MTWLGLGIAAHVFARVAEFQMTSLLRSSRREPDQELPDVELPDAERRAAIERELSRQRLESR